MSSAVIFSDLHLPNHPSDDYRLFLNTLREVESNSEISEIWLLGDIFDYLVGDQKFWIELHGEFWSQLERMAKAGKKILYFEGNHDFAFKRIAIKHGVHAYIEGRCHLFQGRRVFLSHGDEADTDNETYARWRKFTKSARVRLAYKNLPQFITRKMILPFAQTYSGYRKKKRSPLPFENEVHQYQEKYRAYAENMIREKSYHAVFLGHSHIEEVHPIGSKSFYCNLGSWLGEKKTYAIWDPERDSLPLLRVADSKNLP